MKKSIVWLLIAMLTLACLPPLALATNPETGEYVRYENGTLWVYDRVVLQAQVPNTLTTLNEFKQTISDLTAKLASGEITTLDIAGYDSFFPEDLVAELKKLELTDQIDAMLYVLGVLDASALSTTLAPLKDRLDKLIMFDATTGQFSANDKNVEEITLQDFQASSLKSKYGYVLVGQKLKIPFVRIAMEILYDARGDYANKTEAQRRFVENVNYQYLKQGNEKTSKFYLINTVTVARDFFK